MCQPTRAAVGTRRVCTRPAYESGVRVARCGVARVWGESERTIHEPDLGCTARTINIAPGVYQEMLFLRSKNNVTLLGSNNGLGTVIQYDSCDGFNPGTGGGQTVTTPGAGGTIPGYGAATGNLTAGGRPILLTSSSSGLTLDSITIKNLHAQGSRTIATLPASTIAAGATSSATFVNYASAVTQAETMYFNTSFTADISNPAGVAYATVRARWSRSTATSSATRTRWS
jgi:hypothetical protein